MNAKVLIVEDEEPLALLLQYNLEAEGFRVSVARRGDEAEVSISEDPPDLIVLDWMLPGISGFEVCRAVRSFDPLTPITFGVDGIDYVWQPGLVPLKLNTGVK